MLVIGGGVIGLEFATVYTRMGAKVLVVEMMPQPLTGTDLEISKTLSASSRSKASSSRSTTSVKSAREDRRRRQGDAQRRIHQRQRRSRASSRWRWSPSAAARSPTTLNLAAAGLATDDKGFIAVDAQRNTAVEGIYAIGDVTGAPLLAHKAMKEGVVAAEVIAGDKSAAFDPVAVPNCVYTDPEVATVGLSEEEAKAAGYEMQVGKFPLIASGRARTMNETDGLIKLVGDAKTDLLLGMHIVAPQAESLIGEGVIALEMGATLEDIGLSIHPHPTLTESIMDAAEAAHGKAIHILNPKPARRRSAAGALSTKTARLLDLGRRSVRRGAGAAARAARARRRGREPDTWIVVEHVRSSRSDATRRPRTCCSRARRSRRAGVDVLRGRARRRRHLSRARAKSSSIRSCTLDALPRGRAARVARSKRGGDRGLRHVSASRPSAGANMPRRLRRPQPDLRDRPRGAGDDVAARPRAQRLDRARLRPADHAVRHAEFGITSLSRETGREVGFAEAQDRAAAPLWPRAVRRPIRSARSRVPSRSRMIDDRPDRPQTRDRVSRKPEWLKVRLPHGESYENVRGTSSRSTCTRSAKRRCARTSASAGAPAPRRS